MKLKKVMATATMASALGIGALGAAGLANANPGTPMPARPNQCGPDNNCQGPGPGRDNGPDWNRGPGDWNNGPGDWNVHNNIHNNIHNDVDFGVGSQDWWRGRQGKWWRDGDLPPWGFWGAPPAAQWSGPPPWVDPHPINYWGYNATPVWDDGFHGWGIWLFGVWIPIVGIQPY